MNEFILKVTKKKSARERGKRHILVKSTLLLVHHGALQESSLAGSRQLLSVAVDAVAICTNTK